MSIKKMRKIIIDEKYDIYAGTFEDIVKDIQRDIRPLDSIIEDKGLHGTNEDIVHKAQKLKADILNAIGAVIREDMSAGDGTMADLGTPPTYALGSVDARGGSKSLDKENPFLKRKKKKEKVKSEMMQGGEPEISRVMRERSMTDEEAREYLKIKYSKKHDSSIDGELKEKSESFKTGDRVKTIQGGKTVGVVVDRSLLKQAIKDKKILGREYITDHNSMDVLVKDDNGLFSLNPESNLTKIDECMGMTYDRTYVFGYDEPAIQREIKDLKSKIGSSSDEREKSELVCKLQDLLIRAKQKKSESLQRTIEDINGWRVVSSEDKYLVLSPNGTVLYEDDDEDDAKDYLYKIKMKSKKESLKEDFHDAEDMLPQDYDDGYDEPQHQSTPITQSKYPQVIKIKDLKSDSYSDEEGNFDYIEKDDEVQTYLEHVGITDQEVMNQTPYVSTNDIDFIMVSLTDGEVNCLYVGHGVPNLNKDVFKVYEQTYY
jgi:hypothetical protein